MSKINHEAVFAAMRLGAKLQWDAVETETTNGEITVTQVRATVTSKGELLDDLSPIVSINDAARFAIWLGYKGQGRFVYSHESEHTKHALVQAAMEVGKRDAAILVRRMNKMTEQDRIELPLREAAHDFETIRPWMALLRVQGKVERINGELIDDADGYRVRYTATPSGMMNELPVIPAAAFHYMCRPWMGDLCPVQFDNPQDSKRIKLAVLREFVGGWPHLDRVCQEAIGYDPKRWPPWVE